MSILQQKAAKYDEPQRAKQAGIYPYFRVLESGQDPEVIIDNKPVLMFGSNSYLGLTSHPRVKERAIEALKKYGSGAAGSRFLNGTLDIHIELEERLAAYVGKERALAFATGFQSNLGAIPTIIGRKDLGIIDEQSHASIYDATRLSFGRILKYRHNDMESLEKVLKNNHEGEIRMIITDGLFSMEGDIAKLDKIVALAQKYNASVLVDDAHGLGVLGKNGSGTANHFGLDGDIEVIVGTFSKSLASVGGFVAGTREVINFLQHNARSMIFSASLPPASAASVIAALDIIQEEPEHIETLWDNTRFAMELFHQLNIDIGQSETPIIPVYVRDNEKVFLMTKLAYDQGVFVNPVISPAVKPQDTLLRFSLMATHTHQQIERAIGTIYEIGKKLHVFE